MMTEVGMPAGGRADQQIECNEEEEEVLQERKEDEGWLKEADPLPVQVIPIPVQSSAEKTCSPTTASSAVQSAGSSLGFRVNGQLVPLQPGGDSTELKLCTHPKGSVSGFTMVQIPVILTLHSPAGTQHISTTASLSASPPPSPPVSCAASVPTPIITGVISGEAAQKILSDHNVNFKPPTGLKHDSAVASPVISLQATPSPASVKTKQHPSSRPAAPHTLLRKGELGPVRPPDCLICTSQYKLITELRGFMCMCSPAITQSLRNLKRKKPTKRRRGSRNKTRTLKPSRDPQAGSKVSRTSPEASAVWPSDDFFSNQFSTSTSPSSLCKPPQPDLFGPLPNQPHGKLVMLVEDFYYGSTPGRHPKKYNPMGGKFSGPYRCIHCLTTLSNNIKLMSHMQQHMSMLSETDSAFSCPHCFRHFLSAVRLQSHVEAVHSQRESKVTCRICELAFESEPAFLAHMKTTHKPGEMPYVCQECGFRSSFYSDVWLHFEECHANTRNLMCQYCLRVLRRNTCYQQHFIRHQKKHELGCDKCRLHFLYVKELVEHRVLYHRTHIRPPQLSGLKPGTKVTVRTYSVVGGSEGKEETKTSVTPCKVVDVALPPSSQNVSKRKPVERLGLLLSSLSPDRHPWLRHRCAECLNSFPDLRSHYPSLVHCSLCRFVTCCSNSYANHMINNHATCRKAPQYQTIFQSDPKLSEMLMCVTCKLLTCRGDLMANHLTEKPEHTCIMLACTENGTTHLEQTVSEPIENRANAPESDSIRSPVRRGGAFIPIHLLSSQSSTHLSVKPLLSSSFCSQPAMTIKILGPRPPPGQAPVPLLLSQLSIVLSSLCHGVPQAAHHHCTSPMVIRSWTQQQQRGLWHRTWTWKTEEMAEWVLDRREQQLIVSEDMLLLAARAALGGDGRPEDWYSWTVDFMLRHELGLQTTNGNRLKSLQDKSRCFIEALCSQVQPQSLPPRSLGCMDEFPIFIDSKKFYNQNPSSFKLYGMPNDTPLFDIVLSALSDGSLLRPVLFFTGTAPDVPEGFPDNVVLEARPEGFTDQDRLHIWIEKVWRPCVVLKRKSDCLLMVDIHRGHQTETFRRALSSVSTEVIFIPSGCSCRLQPLDICVTQVLRDFLQARWINLVSIGGLDGLGLDQLALTLACWLSEFSSALSSETRILHRSFTSVYNLQQADDQVEVAKMITVLTMELIQPLEMGEPELGSGSEPVELLLRKEEDVVRSPSTLGSMFDSESEQDSFHGFHNE